MNLPNHALFPCRTWSSASGIPVRKRSSKSEKQTIADITYTNCQIVVRGANPYSWSCNPTDHSQKKNTPKKKPKQNSEAGLTHDLCSGDVTAELRCRWWADSDGGRHSWTDKPVMQPPECCYTTIDDAFGWPDCRSFLFFLLVPIANPFISLPKNSTNGIFFQNITGVVSPFSF